MQQVMLYDGWMKERLWLNSVFQKYVSTGTSVSYLYVDVDTVNTISTENTIRIKLPKFSLLHLTMLQSPLIVTQNICSRLNLTRELLFIFACKKIFRRTFSSYKTILYCKEGRKFTYLFVWLFIYRMSVSVRKNISLMQRRHTLRWEKTGHSSPDKQDHPRVAEWPFKMQPEHELV